MNIFYKTLVVLFLIPISSYAQNKDVEIWYARVYSVGVYNPTTEKFEESTLGKNVTITFDKIFNKIELYFTDEKNELIHRTYVFIRNTDNEIKVMKNIEYGDFSLISFDPYKEMSLYKFPNVDNPMTYTCLRNISSIKTW